MKYRLLALSDLEGYFIVEDEHFYKAMHWEEEWDGEGYKDSEPHPSWPRFIVKWIHEAGDFTFNEFD